MVVSQKEELTYEDSPVGRVENLVVSTTAFFETLSVQQIGDAGCFFASCTPFRVFLRPHVTKTSKFIFVAVFAEASADGNRDMSVDFNAEITFRLFPFKSGLPELARGILHHFSPLKNFCAIPEFANWEYVLNPDLGYCQDGKIKLECTVRTGKLSLRFGDRREKTGFVGLRNQGATCYMNSLLQTLFFLNKLRKSTYQIPTGSGDRNDRIISALQGVFYNLQFSESAVETKELTRSFGWNSSDIQVHQDAQELCRLLLDLIETRMKPNRTILSLFEGKMLSFVKCRDVDYQSVREEPFQDIQLNVKGLKNIVDSFRDYCAKELLDGNNKYDAGAYGFQTAEKGVHFKSFPPVLHLHLMRFQYDPIADSNVKVNDRFEFPESLDLEEFLEQPEDTPARYTLHAVLVHSQFTTDTGHYVVYVNVDCKGHWYKFNDESVASVTKTEAIDSNFGGNPECPTTSAYMLVYVRDSAISDAFQEVTRDDIPRHVLVKCDPQLRAEEEAKLVATKLPVRVLLDDAVFRHRGPDIFDSEATEFSILLAERKMRIPAFQAAIAKEFGFPQPRLRFWKMTPRPDSHAIRPVRIEACDNYAVEDLVDQQLLLTIYIEINSTSPLTFLSIDSHVLIFVKFYDPANKSLMFICRQSLSRKSSLMDHEDEFRELIDFGLDDAFVYFKEISPDEVELIDNIELPLNRWSDPIQDGDIIILQKACRAVATTYQLPTVSHYFDWMKTTLNTKIVNRQHPFHVKTSVRIPRDASYLDIICALSEEFQTESDFLRLFTLCENGYPNRLVPLNFSGNLSTLISLPYSKQQNKLAYEEIPNIPELSEEKQILTVLAVSDHLDCSKLIKVCVDSDCSVKNILDAAREVMTKRDPFPSKLKTRGKFDDLRLLLVKKNQIIRFFSPNDRLENFKSLCGLLRVEAVPADQRCLPENAALVPCSLFDEEKQAAIGTPFLVELRDGEYANTFRERIQQKLSVCLPTFRKWRLTVITNRHVRALMDFEKPLRLSCFMFGDPKECHWLLSFGLGYCVRTPTQGTKVV